MIRVFDNIDLITDFYFTYFLNYLLMVRFKSDPLLREEDDMDEEGLRICVKDNLNSD